MLVHRSARRRGIAQLLMEHAEREARAEGRTLLVLDTVTGGDAERLYERLGWTKVGVVPDYALDPDGRPCSTTFFWKAVRARRLVERFLSVGRECLPMSASSKLRWSLRARR